MNTKPALPDLNQLQEHIRYMLAFVVVNHRDQVINILKKNGVILNNPTDKQLLTAVFVSIHKSKAVRKDLQDFITEVAAAELNLKSIPGQSVDDFVKGGADKSGFSNAIGDQLSAGASAGPAAGGATGGSGTGFNDPSLYNDHPWENPSVKTLGTVTVSSGSKKSFGNTAVGSFLSTLFSKDNVNKAVGVGIDLLGQKLSSKATQQELDKATQLEVAKTNALVQQQQTSTTTKAWLVPTLVISGIVVVGVVIALLVARHKKA